MKVVLLGTANPYRGGLAAFNERMALEWQNQGHEVLIYNFTLQYPSFLFPGTSQYNENPHQDLVPNLRMVNSINPLNWIWVGWKLHQMRPDLVIFRYWISFMAPCYTVIAWLLKWNKHSKVMAIVDNAISHEPKFYEKPVAKIFFKTVDEFLTMSDKVKSDLNSIHPTETLSTVHPLYDNYPKAIDKESAREQLQIPLEEKVVLFFGFIRDYKGLDILLEAMASPAIRAEKIKLIVAGEFYSNQEKYETMVDTFQLRNDIYWHTDFIPDAEIVNYFCAADAVVLPYKAATQSGVTQIAFYYHTPIIATNVGGIKEMVIDQEHGYIVAAEAEAISTAIINLYSQDHLSFFKKEIAKATEKYQWPIFVQKIVAHLNR